MPIIKCKMCGGDIQLAEDKTFGTCEYCGSVMTLPKVSDEQRAAAFNRGNHFRRMGEFDKALAVYERIVAEDDADAEAHWCCALCRFGIEYVEDPATYEWLPTCHRASFDSFLEDVDYLAALEHSDGITRRQYQKDAARIAEVQRGILATSQNTEPYDVFISYKELDADGNRTKDSILAQDIYYQLTDKGWRVFFSRISLEDVPGTQYEPYIFAALNSAKVMIVVGTSAENLNAVWVKNEWSRYLSLMRKDRSKLLLPCYRDMDPYDLPEQLSVLMSYDMGKIGFIQDLIRGVDKVLNAEKPKEAAPAPAQPVQERVIVQQSGGGPNVTALLKRGQQALEDGEWDKARGFYDQVLSMDAENAEAFWGLALASDRSRDAEAYIQSRSREEASAEKKYVKRDQAHISEMVSRFMVSGYFEGRTLTDLYSFSVSYDTRAKSRAEIVERAKAAFRADRNLTRAFRFAQGETKQKLEELQRGLFDRLDEQLRAETAADEKAEEQAQAEYAKKLQFADQSAERLSREAEDKRERDYQAACEKLAIAEGEGAFLAAKSAFEKLKGYKDAAERAVECEKGFAAAVKAKKDAAAQAEAAREKKNIIIVSALGTLAVLAFAIFLIVTRVIIPGNSYKDALSLMEEGRYEEAIDAFEALNGYKDSAERAAAVSYAKAESLLADGKTCEAAVAFDRLGDYKDARERSFELWGELTQRETIFASFNHTVGLRSDGTVLAAGDNSFGERDVSDWTDVAAVSAGRRHTVGLRSDGTVLATGANGDGRCEVSGWTDVVAVSAGSFHTVGLRSDGTVLATGANDYGQCDVNDWTDVVAVSAGDNHTVGLRSDGTVLAVGYNMDGRCDVNGWTDVVAVSAGFDHTVGLRSDGTVLATGNNSNGQCEVNGWTGVVAVSAGGLHTVGLRSDGTVLAMGDNVDGRCDVNDWTDVVAVSAGFNHTVGLRSDGTVLAVGNNVNGKCEVGGWTDIKVPN